MTTYLRPDEVANRWSVTAKTLANWRTAGTGPTYAKIGGSVRYKLSDVEAYEAAGRTEAVA